MRRLRVILAALAVATAGASIAAERPAKPLPPPPAILAPADQTAASDLDQAQVALDELEAVLKSPSLGDMELKANQARVAALQARLAADLGELSPHLQDAEARLAQLGPAPAAGQPAEDPATTATRGSLAAQRAAIAAEVAQAKLLSVEAAQLSSSFAQRLRQNFSSRLSARERSVLDPTLWREFADAAPDDLARAGAALRAEGSRLAKVGTTPDGGLILLIVLALSALLLGPARIVLNRLAERRIGVDRDPTALRKPALAALTVLIAGFTPWMAAGVLHVGLDAVGGLTPLADSLFGTAARMVVFAAVLEGLGRALLQPWRGPWRLAPVTDRTAKRLAVFPALIGAALATAAFLRVANGALGTSASSTLASDTIALLIEQAILVGALVAVGRARAERYSAREKAEASRAPWVATALAAWAAVLVGFVSALLGYLNLAIFVTRETIWVAVVLAFFLLGLRLTDQVFPALLSRRTPIGRSIMAALGLSSRALEQLGVLLSGAARLGWLLLAWRGLAAPFSASTSGLFGKLGSHGLTLHLGKATISPGVLVEAAALFAAALMFTRAVRRWLEKHYLPTTRLDLGLRASVASGVSYTGVLIAILAAFSLLGLSVNQIALLASALGVGIGFGLQAIISNFVSGIILLAERPIQVGDWIAVGDQEGDVRRISIRATEIELQDRSKLLVPNSDLLTKAVRNVTQGGALGRVRIVLKVEDDADPKAVRDLLLTRMRMHPKVLEEPPPAAFLTNAVDGALEFTALAYVASPRELTGVKSDLLLEIFPALKAIEARVARTSTVVNVSVPSPSPLSLQQGGHVDPGGDEAGEGQQHQEAPGGEPDLPGPGGPGSQPAEQEGERQGGGGQGDGGGKAH